MENSFHFLFLKIAINKYPNCTLVFKDISPYWRTVISFLINCNNFFLISMMWTFNFFLSIQCHSIFVTITLIALNVLLFPFFFLIPEIQFPLIFINCSVQTNSYIHCICEGASNWKGKLHSPPWVSWMLEAAWKLYCCHGWLMVTFLHS